MGWLDSSAFNHATGKKFMLSTKPIGLLSLFLGTQLITQVVALAVGLLVVRLLPIEQYAIYALFGALVGAAAVASDLGTSGSFLTLVSRSSERSERVSLLNETAQIRTGLSLGSIPIFGGLFLWVTPQTGWQSIATVSFLALVILLQASAVLDRSILASEKRLTVINRADPCAALARLMLMGGALIFYGQSGALFPIAVWALSEAMLAVWLRRNAGEIHKWPPTLPGRAMSRIMLPLLPGHLYYVFAGLLPLLSLSSLGATVDMAEFWALGRLAAVFAIITPMLNLIVHPYVSRGHDQRFAQRSSGIIAVCTALVVFVVMLGWLFPGLWLLALGGTYAHLDAYVWLALLVPGVGLLSSVLYTMAISSGETGRQYFTVPVGIATQVIVLWLSPIININSAFRFALITTGVQLVVQLLLYLRSLRIIKARREGKTF